jgi:hypothetical protein
VERDTYRFNLVLDTIENEYVFGGVATAIITGTLFALTRKMSLRIITRYSSENPEAYFKFLDIMAIDHPKDIEFFSDALHKGAQQDMLEVSDKDVFMASSWWTSYVVSLVSIRKNFFHIIQELETVFYPYGDHTYWCERALQNPRSRYVVNSKVLFDFYQKYDLDHIKKNSVYFEPAFPKRLYMPSDDTFKPKTKYRLLFYARPHIDRNMYYTGIQCIEEAFMRGILDKEKWDIVFAGDGAGQIKFSNGVIPQMSGKLTWSEYSDLLKTVDLGFSLLYTPHPGYMPMDVASSGGVALTNTYRAKTNTQFSKNIISCDLNDNFVVDAFARAVQLAQNPEERHRNYLENAIEQDWLTTLSDSFKYIDKEL